MVRRLALTALAALLCAGPVRVAAASRILVADRSGAVVEVDSESGEQHLVAFGWREPRDFVVAPGGDVWVLDAGLLDQGGIIEIDAGTGRQSILTLGEYLLPSRTARAMALDLGGSPILAKDLSASTPLIAVDPTTGSQVELDADFARVQGLAFEPGGNLLVATPQHLHRVDATTGDSSVLSEGGFFVSLTDVVVTPDGAIFVASGETPQTFTFGSVLRVDPASGAQTLVFAGGPLGRPVGLDLDSTGKLIVAFARRFMTGPGGISRIDPSSHQQTIVRQAGILDYAVRVAVLDDQTYLVLVDQNGTEKILAVDAATGAVSALHSGGTIGMPLDLAVAPSGDLLVANRGEWGGERWSARVDPETGGQSFLTPDLVNDLVLEDADTLLTLGDGGVSERDPATGEPTREIQPDVTQWGQLALEASGNLLVLDPGFFFCDTFECYKEPGTISRIDRASGEPTVLVEDDELIDARSIELDAAGDPWITVGSSIVHVDLPGGERRSVAQGGLLVAPGDLAFGGAGSLFVADPGAGAVLEVDLGTGDQSIVSEDGYLSSPTGLYLAPEPSRALQLSAALGALGCLALISFSRSPRAALD